ncbi:M20 family metallo-hydrolase [Alteribacillus sp. HJP-4]|uniref:M20 family metallo-hydrolase n=1 Tax=Alteribacillus sp. HJP-4 TaxID=2775394 RepID=UPI0035CCD99A
MISWLQDTLLRLNVTDTMEQTQGFTRLGYTNDETSAMQAFTDIAFEIDLYVRTDEAGNKIASWFPDSKVASQRGALAMGSHLDTVERGGGYDGAAGVLCALGAVKKLKGEGIKLNRPVEVICFASEESARFGVSTIGSKAMSGLLTTRLADELKGVTDKHGTSIKEALESQGNSWDFVTEAVRPKEDIYRFIELHIEQGQRVENAGADIGVVHAIACPIRLKIHLKGKAGHTGTTPMNSRRDAFATAAPLISFIQQRAEELSEGPNPVVATVSTVEVLPNVMNVIPGDVLLGVDIRSVEDSLKIQMEEEIRRKAEEIEQDTSIIINIEKLVDNPSVFLDAETLDELRTAVQKTGLSSFNLESGAGHDVMNMASKWKTGLLFIRCKDGLSHHPEEHVELKDLDYGVQALAAYVKQEAGAE